MSGGITTEELYSAIEESARLVDAPFSRDKVWPVLSAYRDGFGAGGVIFSLQAGERVEELEYTVQVSPGIDDPYAHALSNGFVAETDHPVSALLSDIQARIPGGEYYIDCGVVGGFKKIYANFPHDAQKVSKLAGIPSMPRAVDENSDFFARYGLEDVVLIGVDYKHRTMNLYFQLPAATAGNLEPKTVLSMLRETGMHEPDEQMLAYAAKSYRIYTTLSWDSSEIHRVSFGPKPRRDMDLSALPARLEPRLEQFMRTTPHKYAGDLINASAAKWSHDREFLDLAAYYQISPLHLKALTAAGEEQE
ncbi:aromatic prenyltransferase [Streptomyces sp. NBC_00873]|uniref:aromatic prenyltransferase n=1 Tax=unclassified Streptomyces TaxID=2593676 RepID=UPI0038668C65|nr:aromatic prenyltransferase [Streptomyces sp. NBC_00873]WSY96713.1 aromatic prenyltransferase [Streptomyces sp. NBC_00873]WTA41513.1 aromatic prenyltransferase [Streptomyces sp. NBC_00842]WTA48383.1 aromatic prenyltransferase [Streptomyces sp. NBC_00842]